MNVTRLGEWHDDSRYGEHIPGLMTLFTMFSVPRGPMLASTRTSAKASETSATNATAMGRSAEGVRYGSRLVFEGHSYIPHSVFASSQSAVHLDLNFDVTHSLPAHSQNLMLPSRVNDTVQMDCSDG